MIKETERLEKMESVKGTAVNPEEIIVLGNGNVYRVAKFDSITFIIARSILLKAESNAWDYDLIQKFMNLKNIQICSPPEYTGYSLSLEAIGKLLEDNNDFELLHNHYCDRYIAFRNEYEEKKRALNQ